MPINYKNPILQCAHLSRAIYLDKEGYRSYLKKTKYGLGKSHYIVVSDPWYGDIEMMYVKGKDGYDFVVFRGIGENDNLLSYADIRYTKYKGLYLNRVSVHRYLPLKKQLKRFVKKYKPKSLYFCGHSYGGVLACVASLDYLKMCKGVYSFGQPDFVLPYSVKKLNKLLKNKYVCFRLLEDVIVRYFTPFDFFYTNAGYNLYLGDTCEVDRFFNHTMQCYIKPAEKTVAYLQKHC